MHKLRIKKLAQVKKNMYLFFLSACVCVMENSIAECAFDEFIK